MADKPDKDAVLIEEKNLEDTQNTSDKQPLEEKQISEFPIQSQEPDLIKTSATSQAPLETVRVSEQSLNSTQVVSSQQNMIEEGGREQVVDITQSTQSVQFKQLVENKEQPGFGDDFGAFAQQMTKKVYGVEQVAGNLNYIDHTLVGQIVPLTPNLYFQTFKVSNPQKVANYFAYEVSGTRKIAKTTDSNQNNQIGFSAQDYEAFTVLRRYSDFDTLREVLVQRWPGFYIPALPPKSVIVSIKNFLVIQGNTEPLFVSQRTIMLNNFLRDLSRQNCLIESEEFLLFTSFTQDQLKDQYKKLKSNNPGALLNKYQQICAINMPLIKGEEKQSFIIGLEKFSLFVNACLASQNVRLERQEKLIERKMKLMSNDRQLLTSLLDYEKHGLEFYGSNEKQSQQVENKFLAKDVTILAGTLLTASENPYQLMMRWILTETQELLSMKDTIQSIQIIKGKINELREQLEEDRELLAAEQQNKTTFRGLWRKITGKKHTEDQLAESVVVIEALIDQWSSLLNYVEISIWLVVVPRFCQDRGSDYMNFLNDFAQCHITICDKKIEKWKVVMDNTVEVDSQIKLLGD